MEKVFASAAVLSFLLTAGVWAAEPLLADDFGTAASQVDTQKWQAWGEMKLPHMDWLDNNRDDAYVAGQQGNQLLSVMTFGDAPASAEFDVRVWNVVEGAAYNLFGFVTPEGIWKTNNAVAWKISGKDGKLFAMPYTTCHEGDVLGWHEHGGKVIEIGDAPTATCKFRVDWTPGVSAAFYLNGELRETMTVEIPKSQMRFGTDMQACSWGIDNVKVTKLEGAAK